MGEPRVDVGEILRSYSRKLLHDFREGVKTSNFAFDRGIPREKAVREFLGARLPQRYAVGEGLVVDAEGGQSQQCDVVIYDRERTPVLSTETAMNIWPFEAVYAVAQVKSKLTRTELESAVANIASFKALSRTDNNFAGGPGLMVHVGKTNHAFGMLIAHEIDVELNPQELLKVLTAVPREHQIDVYCAISGRVGFRVQENREAGLVVDLEAHGFLEPDYGDGALATFLFLVISIMNEIQLGRQTFLKYTKYLEKPQ
jgi:hypothetical protein